ncbi:MAG: methyl-coenzyme M reductase operon protein D [Methanobacteriaceae archaeon]
MDIEIFPHRILGADTTEKLLNEIENLDGVVRTVLQGPRLPPEDDSVPAKYRDRRKITVKGKEIDLKVKTGRIFIEINNESVIDEVRTICESFLTFGFDINMGKYIRSEKTVTDNIKYGEQDIPDELIGMTDQNARIADRVTILKK